MKNLILSTMLAAVFAGGTAFADEEAERTFTDAKGRTLQASLVRVIGNDAWLRIGNDVREIPIRTLSQADQAYCALHREFGGGVKKGVQGGSLRDGGPIKKTFKALLKVFVPIPGKKHQYLCWEDGRLIFVDQATGGPYGTKSRVECKLIPKSPLLHPRYAVPQYSAVDLRPQ